MSNLLKNMLPALMAVIVSPGFAQGSLVTEGKIAHSADQVGATGVGVTVGVIGSAINADRLTYLQGLSNPELPAVSILPVECGAPVTPAPYTIPAGCYSLASIGADDTAALDAMQIVHDMAPGASLVFISPDPGAASEAEGLALAAADLQSAGVDVVLDLVSVPDEAMFYEDELAQAISAIADNLVYIVAAGDEGSIPDGSGYLASTVYETPFNPILRSDTSVDLGAGFEYIERVHSWDGTLTNVELQIEVALDSLCLHWADTPDGSYNDYDLFVLDDTGAVVASSTDFQIYGDADTPAECITDTAALVAGNQVVIGTDDIASENRYVHLRGVPTEPALRTMQDLVASPNSRTAYSPTAVFEITTGGAVRGRAALENVIAVGSAPTPVGTSGAEPFSKGDVVSTISSVGPTLFFYDYDTDSAGYVITAAGDQDLNSPDGADVRVKPDVAGAERVLVYRVPDTLDDRVPTQVVGSAIGAAHIAGMTAQMLEGRPVIPVEILVATLSNTVDLGVSGNDGASGFGAPKADEVFAQVELPLLPYSLSVAANRGSATVTFVGSPDDNGFDYLASCVQRGTITTQLFSDQLITSGYTFGVLPGSTVECTLKARSPSADVSAAIAGNTGTATVEDLQAPTLDKVTAEPFGFTVAYGLDPEAADDTYTNSIQCLKTADDSEAIAAGTSVPASPATFDDDLEPEQELTCTLDLVAKIRGVSQPSGTAQFVFAVTPENMSGLPIWLLYEATKAAAPAQP